MLHHILRTYNCELYIFFSFKLFLQYFCNLKLIVYHSMIISKDYLDLVAI